MQPVTSMGDDGTTLPEMVKRKYFFYKQKVDGQLNRTIPYKKERWIAAGVMFVVFMLRVILSHRFYSTAYFLYVYLLSAFITFITPNDAVDYPDLPVTSADLNEMPGFLSEEVMSQRRMAKSGEYKNYTRRMPEYTFWVQVVIAHGIAIIWSLFPFLDIPVWWPILVFYAVILTYMFVAKELDRWKEMDVKPIDAVKTWFSMDKPKYSIDLK